ncbi:MAG: glycine cleavage system protein GcvH [Spirochaetia bacterium]|jgi:glycine cleavage system H protein|nr:glycine cleavage system protein GcvH [Spirochaetia bacterium]
MSTVDDELKYTGTHEWVRLGDNFEAVCGISDHAQEMLTDIVFVDLPDLALEVRQGEQIAVVESGKAVSDIFSPVTGEIIAINNALEDSPEIINSDPYGAGWIFKIDATRTSELDSLMSPDEYREYIDSGN